MRNNTFACKQQIALSTTIYPLGLIQTITSEGSYDTKAKWVTLVINITIIWLPRQTDI